MSDANLDLSADQGADFALTLTLKDSALALIDLTGHTFRGKVKKRISDSDAVLNFVFSLANQTTNKGQVNVSISLANMTSVALKPQNGQVRKPEEFVYDIEWIKPDATVKRLLEGRFLISPEVTT